jgi:uncharacterized protein (UPF0264 family)
MVDTAIKDGSTLFDALSFEEIAAFIQAARAAALRVALAGSIQQAHLPLLQQLQPDIIGVRGAFCNKADRTTGVVLERVCEFVHAVRNPAADAATMGV